MGLTCVPTPYRGVEVHLHKVPILIDIDLHDVRSSRFSDVVYPNINSTKFGDNSCHNVFDTLIIGDISLESLGIRV